MAARLPFPVPATNDGARHDTGNLRLGTGLDHEDDGLPSEDAGRSGVDGDDGDGIDDDDGVAVLGPWTEGTSGGTLRVKVTGGEGYLSGWIDWDDNKQFSDSGDHVLDMVAVSNGSQTVRFDVPVGALPATGAPKRYARFRLAPLDTPSMPPSGAIYNGEVEDYEWPVGQELQHTGDSPVHYVTTNGASIWPYTNWSDAAYCIQDAVDAAVAGDCVLVSNGIYQAGGRWLDGIGFSRIAVTSAIDVASVNGPDYTRVVGYRAAFDTLAYRGAYLGAGAALSGFTVEGGFAHTNGGGVSCVGSVALSNCVFTGNESHAAGGGVYGGILFDCDVEDNQARSGGGVASGTLARCSVLGNTASTNGGGVYGGVLSDCFVSENTAVYGGGGIAHSEADGCWLSDNSATMGGGAYFGTLSGCLVSNNSASWAGGGVYSTFFSGSTASHCTIIHNEALKYGGGAYGGALEYCLVKEYTVGAELAFNESGGGATDSRLYSCIVRGNYSYRAGGGAGKHRYGTRLHSCLVQDNEAVENGAGTYYSYLYNCTVVQNEGYGVYEENTYNSIVYYNAATPPQNVMYRSSCYTAAGGYDSAYSNISVAPQFVSVSGNDFQLQEGSPCQDSGDNSYVQWNYDLEGNMRISGGHVDRGAYEIIQRTTLLVTGRAGTCDPEVGAHQPPSDTSVTCLVTNSPDLDGTWRYVCTGWLGTGDAPATGDQLEVEFLINSESSVAWQWKTQCWLEVQADFGGSVNTTSQWIDSGSSFEIEAIPDYGYHWTNWMGLPPGDNPQLITMSSPRDVTAQFAINTYSLTTLPPEHGLILPSSAVTDHGGSRLFTATPTNDEYTVGEWTVDSAPVQQGGETYELQNIVTDHTVGVTFELASVPRAPTDLNAELMTDGRVHLRWQENSLAEDRMIVERRWNETSLWGERASLSPDATQYVDSAIAAGMRCYYRVVAENALGRSAPSDVATISMPTAPAAPSGLQGWGDGTNVYLVWTDHATNEWGFLLERRKSDEVEVVTTEIGADLEAWTDAGAPEGAQLLYELRAFNPAGRSMPVTTSVETPYAVNWNHSLVISNAMLAFNGVEGASSTLAGAPLTGVFDARQSNPHDEYSVHRVALGFRDQAGHSVGDPFEVSALREVPGSPGDWHVGVPVPEGLATPLDPGTYALWCEAYVGRAPRPAFMETRRTITNDMTVLVTNIVVTSPVATVIRAGEVTCPAAGRVKVPIYIEAKGGEQVVKICVSETSNLSIYRTVVCWRRFWCYHTLYIYRGVIQPEMAQVYLGVDGNVSAGEYVFTVTIPSWVTLQPGIHHLMDLVFVVDGSAADGADLTVDLGPNQFSRYVRDQGGSTMPAQWENGVVEVTGRLLEGDIAYGYRGDGVVTMSDWHRMSRIISGVELLRDDEFRRADCAPRATFGDGVIDTADLQQIGRYAAGLDSAVSADGPEEPIGGGLSRTSAPRSSDAILAVIPTNIARSTTGNVQIQIVAQGDERAINFTLAYDPVELTHLDVALCGAMTNGVMFANTTEPGALGVVLQLPAAYSLPVGTNTILNVRFGAAPGHETVTTVVSFADSPTPRGMANAGGDNLNANWQNASIPLTASGLPLGLTAPSNLTSEAISGSEVALKWSAADGEDEYQIWRQSACGDVWRVAAEGISNQTAFTDSGLMSNMTYRYRVAAVAAAGAAYSPLATAVTWNAVDVWRAAQFGTTKAIGGAADDADWDGDGEANLLEYALGRSPLVFDTDPAYTITWEAEGTSVYAVVRYSTSDPAPAGVEIAPELSTNLLSGPWVADLELVNHQASNGVDTIWLRPEVGREALRYGYFRLRATR